MTLEDVGNIGELVGAIGVVITLLYVAIQVRDNSRFIRENTASVKATNEITSNEFTSAIFLAMLKDPELLDIQLRGHRGEQLEHMEHVRYSLILRMGFEGHQTYFVQQTRGLVGNEIWNHWSRDMDAFCRLPGVIHWWSRNGSKYDPEFQKYIDEKVKADNALQGTETDPAKLVD